MANPGVYAFEEIDEALAFLPLSARRLLDGLGRKLTLEAWRSLPPGDRARLVRAGADEALDLAAGAVLEHAVPPPEPIAVCVEPDPGRVPEALVVALGEIRPLDASRWAALGRLDRYALAKYASNPPKLARAYDEIVGGRRLTHVTAAGEAHMVDVGAKAETARRAVARACVRTTRAAVDAVATSSVSKGDVLAAARIAGILAAKRTAELVPLCHPVRTTRAAVDFEVDPERGELRVRAEVEALDRTGVEMEAMVAASVASLTLYDMIKAVDRWATIESVRLETKSGGKSGDLRRPAERGGA